jgi:hypothetical protein
MAQNPGYTIRSEAEQGAVSNLRNAMFWRVKIQLQTLQTVTAQQYKEIVTVAYNDAQFACQELMNLYTGIETHQKAGWRAFDCFDRVASQPPAPQQQQQQQPPPPQAAPPAPGAPPPPAGQPQPQHSEVDNIGKDLQKGLKDIGGALEGLFGQKKK